ncbi:hypothetical protein Tco_0364936 [Tanacetum coccineum]
MFHQDQPSPSTYMQQLQPINNNYNPQPSFNQNYIQQPMPNPENITDPTTAMNMALVLMIAQPSMNMGQDRQMQMVGGNGGNQFRQYAGQNVRNQNGYNAVQNVGNQVVQNAVQNPGVQNVGNQNGLIVVPRITNQNPNRNEVLDEIEEVNANYILIANFMEQSGGTVDQHPATVEETRAYFESLYNNLAIEVEKIKELDNILVKTGQSIQTMHMLSPKPDSFYHTEQKLALGYQNPFYLKQAQQKQQSLYDGKTLLEKHDPPVVYDSEETLQLA